MDTDELLDARGKTHGCAINQHATWFDMAVPFIAGALVADKKIHPSVGQYFCDGAKDLPRWRKANLGCALMALLKASRIANQPKLDDHYDDAEGYMRLAKEAWLSSEEPT